MFKLKFIKFTNHPLFKNNEYNLSNVNLTNNFKTVIIGSNGTGKSILLREICDIFIAVISNLEQNREDITVDFDFELQYIFNSEEYNISKNNSKIINFKNIVLDKLPNQMLALSYNLNDKYPLLTKKNKNFTDKYKYLGIKSTTNNAFISKHRKDFIDNIYYIFKDENNKKNILNNFFDDMQLPKKYRLHISKGVNFKKLFKEINSTKLNNIITTIINDNKMKSKRFSDSKFEQLSKDEKLQNKILFFYNQKLNLSSKEKSKYIMNYDIFIENIQLDSDFLEDYIILEILISIEVLKFEELEIIKNDNYTYNSSSSGEFHIINSITSIIAYIDNNSFIFIDEPEVSLHPNWQIKYIELLNKIINEYTGCHIIIATHSHFLISSLNSSNTTILSTKKTFDDNIQVNEINENTFGWSAENILYNVFGIATTRNSYFEKDLTNLIQKISSKQGTYEDIKELLQKFSKFNITKDDPLNEVLNMAKFYLEEIK